MAKESMKSREVKREKTVAKYAEKRKALLEAGDFVGLQNYQKMLLLFVYTTVANQREDQEVISVNSVFHV